jgi:hypothetical protein
MRPYPTFTLLALLFCLATPAVARANAIAKQVFTFKSGAMRFAYDLRDGMASILWDGGGEMRGAYSAVRLGCRAITSKEYARRVVERRGSVAVVTLTDGQLPTMRQRFDFSGPGFLTVRVEVDGKGLASNWMAPLMVDSPGGVDLGAGNDWRALAVPFDNDKWARYDAAVLNGSGTSYEVAAFYDNASRHGLVVGSVTHDTWKTGITYRGAAGSLEALTVFGGIADGEGTHDVEAHGAVAGREIRSPEVMVGFYTDWRDGMEAFADANAKRAPMLKWTGGTPFGWNSWGKVQASLNADTAVATSDYFAERMQPRGFQNHGTAYINLDSYWDNLSQDELRRFTEHCRARGQKPGIYWAPFVYWGDNLDAQVEGANATYADAVLRTRDGTPRTLDGAFALDPTHPATLRRIDHFIDRFRALGFEYIKLDFLSHGALEGGSRDGRHFDPAIHTGIQAYNSGMQYLLTRIGSRMFISASIAPLFPHGYAHARRVSCDSYGRIGETEYMMNSAGYGWWASGRLYAFNDPDHMVLDGFTPSENQSRVTSGAVAGTVFLNGDDVTRASARRRLETYLTNDAVNAVARLGKPFRPVEGNSGRNAPDVMTLYDGGNWYLAAFHFDGGAGTTRAVDLARAGLEPGTLYKVTDLWTGRAWEARDRVTITLRPAESTILKLERIGAPAAPSTRG